MPLLYLPSLAFLMDEGGDHDLNIDCMGRNGVGDTYHSWREVHLAIASISKAWDVAGMSGGR